MATYTSNFNLEMPDQNEYYDVDVFNENARIIDENMKETQDVANGSVQKTTLYTVYTTTGTASAYQVEGVEPFDGLMICVKLHVDSSDAPTLNGAPMMQYPQRAFRGKLDGVYTFRYVNGSYYAQWGVGAPFVVKAVLTAAGWSSRAQTVSVSGVLDSSCGDLYSAPSATAEEDEAFTSALLKVTGQADGTITVTCRGDVPAIDLPIEVEVRN